MAESSVELGNLVMSYVRAEAYEEIFEELLHDIGRDDVPQEFVYGADAHDMEVLLMGRIRPPARGTRRVTMPYLWHKFFEGYAPEENIRIVLPPSAILEFFSQLFWRSELLRSEYGALRQVAKSKSRDLQKFRREVEKIVPGLVKLIAEGDRSKRSRMSPGLYGLQKLWRERKLLPVQSVLPGTGATELRVPDEFDGKAGLEWLEVNRVKEVGRGELKDFFDKADILNLEVFARAREAFREEGACGAMTSMGWYTRQAYLKCWQNEDRFQCPSRHPAAAITLLVTRRELANHEDRLDFLREGILLLRRIRREIRDIPEARAALDAARGVRARERVGVSVQLQAAINDWMMSYFYPLYQVEPPDLDDGEAVERLVSMMDGTNVEKVAQQASESIAEQAREVFREDFEEFLDEEEFLPLDNPRTGQVLRWLRGEEK